MIDLDANKIRVCPSCGESDCFITVEDSLVCCKCGYVIDTDIISMEAPPIYGMENIATKATTETPSPPYISIIRSRLIKFTKNDNKFPLSNKERLYNKVQDAISHVATKLGISKDIKNLALIILYNYASIRKIRKKAIDEAALAAIYLSFKLKKRPKSLDLLAKQFKLRKSSIARIYKDMITQLKIRNIIPKPENYIRAFGRDLKLSNSCITLAMKIIKSIRERKKWISGEPRGVAAAAIYLATEMTGETRERKEIARVAAVTELTIKKRYNDIKKALSN